MKAEFPKKLITVAFMGAAFANTTIKLGIILHTETFLFREIT